MSAIVNGVLVNNDFSSRMNPPVEGVDHPSHYQGNRECIDVMESVFGTQAVIDFCKCNSFKYRFRAGNKPGEGFCKDIAKAEWYESKLTELLNKSEEDWIYGRYE